jgi:hypothetical protein
VRNLLTRRTDNEPPDTAADERVVDRRVRDESTTTRRTPAFLSRRQTDDRAARVTAPVAKPSDTATTEIEQPRWAHVSATATASLVIGVLALAVTLSGLLAAEGIALGVIGGALAAGGLVAASRRGVTGHSLALLGLLASIAAILLGILAIGGQLSWLDSKTDEVAKAHNWLIAQLPWLKHW